MSFRSLLVLGAAVGCTASSSSPLPAPLAPLLRPERPVVIAHRGGRTSGPEETLATLERSAELGAEVLELDLHATSDGTVVCLHDATVDRTTNGTGPVASFSLDGLRKLDAGYRFSSDGVSFPFRDAGVTVPTLDEVLGTGPRLPLVLEIKQREPPIVDEVMRVLRSHDALDRVVLAAFSADILDEVRAHPDAPATSMAVSEVIAWLATGDAPGRFLHLPPEVGPLKLVDAELIADAEAQDLAVQVWTISEPDQMRAMVELGVHGILTTDPETLAEVVRAHRAGVGANEVAP